MAATRLVQERFGELELRLETLADLDLAVDELLARVDDRPGLLERDLCPYFGVIWPAARALAGALVQRRQWLPGRSVLEIGCGLALPALLAARLGARVTATDLHPDVPGFLARNLRHNGLGPDALEFLELDWRGGALGRRFDLVLGSDILYEAGHPLPVAAALAEHVAEGGGILLADPGRAHLQACVDELQQLGFRAALEVVAVDDPASDRAGDATTREVFLIALER